MPQSSSPPATGAVRLDNTSDVDGSEGALSNPESHTFDFPVVGGAGSLLPRRAGVRAHTLEGDPGVGFIIIIVFRRCCSCGCCGCYVYACEIGERERQGSRLQSVHRLGHRVQDNSGNNNRRKRHRHRRRFCHSPCSRKILRAGSTTTRTVTLAQAMSEASSRVQTRAHTPTGVPIPSSPSPTPPQSSSPHPSRELSTAPTSFVTASPMIVSRTTDSGGDGRTPNM
jgi:hypothetical protein